MDLHYSNEKLYLALRGMAISPDSLRQRIANVMIAHLHPLVDHESLPEALNAQLQAYAAEWTQQPESARGQIQTWVDGLSDAEADQVARWIVEAHYEVQRLLRDG